MSTTPEAIRQSRYRERRSQRFTTMQSALEQILVELSDNEKPLAVKLRFIARDGLSLPPVSSTGGN